MMFFSFMKNKLRQLAQEDSGIAAFFTLFLSVPILVMILAVFVLGQNIQRKINLQSAVDNVAYAGALAEADTLSKMAVLNRAIAWTYVQNNRRHVDYILQRFGYDILRAFWFDSMEAAIQQYGTSIKMSKGELTHTPGLGTTWNGGVCPYHNAYHYCEKNNTLPIEKPNFKQELDWYDGLTFFLEPANTEIITLENIANHIPNLEKTDDQSDDKVLEYENSICFLSPNGTYTIRAKDWDTNDGANDNKTELDTEASLPPRYDRVEGFFKNAYGMEDRLYGVCQRIDFRNYKNWPTNPIIYYELDHNLLTSELTADLANNGYKNWIRHGYVQSEANELFDIRDLYHLIRDAENEHPYTQLEEEIIQGSKTLEALNQALESLALGIDLKIRKAMDAVAEQYSDLAFNFMIGGHKYMEDDPLSETASNIAKECFYVPDERMFFQSTSNGHTIVYDDEGHPLYFGYSDIVPRRTYRDSKDKWDVDADGWQACETWWARDWILADESSNYTVSVKYANNTKGFRHQLVEKEKRPTSGDWSSYAYIWNCREEKHEQMNWRPGNKDNETDIHSVPRMPWNISNRFGNSVIAGFYPNTVNPHYSQVEQPPFMQYEGEIIHAKPVDWLSWISLQPDYQSYANLCNSLGEAPNPNYFITHYDCPYEGMTWSAAYNDYVATFQEKFNEWYENYKEYIDWFFDFPKTYGMATTKWKNWENTDGLCNYDQSAMASPLHVNHRLFTKFGSIFAFAKFKGENTLANLRIFGNILNKSDIWSMSAARAGYRLPKLIRGETEYTSTTSGIYQTVWNEIAQLPAAPGQAAEWNLKTGYEADWNLMADDWDVVILPVTKVWKVGMVNDDGSVSWNETGDPNDAFNTMMNTGDHYTESNLLNILKDMTDIHDDKLKEVVKHVLH